MLLHTLKEEKIKRKEKYHKIRFITLRGHLSRLKFSLIHYVDVLILFSKYGKIFKI